MSPVSQSRLLSYFKWRVRLEAGGASFSWPSSEFLLSPDRRASSRIQRTPSWINVALGEADVPGSKASASATRRCSGDEFLRSAFRSSRLRRLRSLARRLNLLCPPIKTYAGENRVSPTACRGEAAKALGARCRACASRFFVASAQVRDLFERVKLLR